MRTVTTGQRRRLVTRRHHLAGRAASPEEATRAVIARHATDPASVYLPVLARSSTSSMADVAASMYQQRSLVRWLGMRRTLFLVPCEDVPLVQAAASSPVAAALRTQLVRTIERNGTRPPLDADAGSWADTLAERAEQARNRRCVGAVQHLSCSQIGISGLCRVATLPQQHGQQAAGDLLRTVGGRARLDRGTQQRLVLTELPAAGAEARLGLLAGSRRVFSVTGDGDVPLFAT